MPQNHEYTDKSYKTPRLLLWVLIFMVTTMAGCSSERADDISAPDPVQKLISSLTLNPSATVSAVLPSTTSTPPTTPSITATTSSSPITVTPSITASITPSISASPTTSMPSIPPTASTPPITIAPSITPTASAPPVTQGPNAGYLIAIDPGHQGRGNSEQEPIGPGADESKAKVASGTQGVSTKVPEYELTLLVAFRLRDQLTARGYQVIMIRESHDVDISNRERAERATEAGADILVRLHANGSESSDAAGITTLCPSAGNPYIPHLYEPSRTLSESVQAALITATAARDRGITEADNMSGINWATIPVTIVEMGFMTNQTEDELMQTEDYQQKLVEGMANGIDEYFALASEKASSAEALLKGYPF